MYTLVNVVIFGATGMLGKGVLLECLDDPRLHRIVVTARSRIDISHPKRIASNIPRDRD
jgi:dTDP-4-dehydrorhamnose reductase